MFDHEPPTREQMTEQFDILRVMEPIQDSYEAGLYDALGWVLGAWPEPPVELEDESEEPEGAEERDDYEDPDFEEDDEEENEEEAVE